MSVHHSVPGFSVDAALDAYVRIQTAPRAWDGGYHPSSLFSCDRKQIYEVRDTPRDGGWTFGQNRALVVGNTLGPVLQAAITEQVGGSLREAYIEPGIDVPDLNIRGHIDAFVIHADGTPEVIEDKTAHSFSWSEVRKSGEAKPEHINQGMTYLFCIKHFGFYTEPEYDDDYLCPNCQTPWKCNGPHITETPQRIHHPAVPDLEWLRVAYWDKNRHGIWESKYRITQEWEDQLLAHIERLEKYRADGAALPPRIAQARADNWLCKGYCDFAQRCWGVDSEGTEL